MTEKAFNLYHEFRRAVIEVLQEMQPANANVGSGILDVKSIEETGKHLNKMIEIYDALTTLVREMHGGLSAASENYYTSLERVAALLSNVAAPSAADTVWNLPIHNIRKSMVRPPPGFRPDSISRDVSMRGDSSCLMKSLFGSELESQHIHDSNITNAVYSEHPLPIPVAKPFIVTKISKEPHANVLPATVSTAGANGLYFSSEQRVTSVTSGLPVSDASRERPIDTTFADVVKQPPRPDVVRITHDRFTYIQITRDCGLNAINVANFTDVSTAGELYYVTSADHFALRVCGFLFHANIGEIYTNESEPIKIKECKYAQSCAKPDCTYYHDPIRCPKSHDVRNYVANSSLYVAPYTSGRLRKAVRSFGCKKYLDSDIDSIDAEDVSRMCDQAMHDMLCALLLKSKVAKTTSTK